MATVTKTKSPLVLRALQPAPPRTVQAESQKTCFYDLPAELRIEIYALVLEKVTIHILPVGQEGLRGRYAHPLVRTSRQIRNEVLPIVHRSCIIRANVTDFNFDGVLAWMARIAPEQHANLCKNTDLSIRLCTTLKPPAYGDTLRRWLHLRADSHRPQPGWRYTGPEPKNKVAADLKRRTKRMTELGKRKELLVMLEAIGVSIR